MKPGIWIDCGHSPRDPGAVGNGLTEHELNHAIAKRLVKRLRAHGLRVGTDLDNDRTAADSMSAASRWGGVYLFVSLHHNGFGDRRARGFEVYGTGKSRSRRLAEGLHDGLGRALGSFDATIPDRGVKEARGTRAEAIVLRSPGSSALVECLFVTNPKDAAIAAERKYAARVAEQLCRSIITVGRDEGRWATRYVAREADPEPTKPTKCQRELRETRAALQVAEARSDRWKKVAAQRGEKIERIAAIAKR